MNTISTLSLRFIDNMHRYLLYFFLFCGFIFSVSCKKEKLKSPKASFLVVDHVSVKTILNQGTTSHKITDIWYYVDGQFKGVFPIGSVMPVVATDNAEITLFAGIKNNGISSTRAPYPFYNSVVFTQTLQAGKTYTISPEFEYSSTATFWYTQPQDFDSQFSFSQFQSTGDSSYVRVTDPAKTFGGTGGSIFMSMSDAKPTSKMVQTNEFNLPIGGKIVYLELNYKCNQPVTVGIIGNNVDERGAITLSDSKGEWNKIYIQLTSIISSPPTYPGYLIFIKAVKAVNTPEIYIDNIKLISE